MEQHLPGNVRMLTSPAARAAVGSGQSPPGGAAPDAVPGAVLRVLSRAVGRLRPLGPPARHELGPGKVAFTLAVLTTEVEAKRLRARSRRAGQRRVATLARVERRLRAPGSLSPAERRALAAALARVREAVTPLLVGFPPGAAP